MRTPQSHTPREKVLAEIRQRPDAGTRPAPETSAAGAATMRVVGGAAIALAASMAIQNAMFVAVGRGIKRGVKLGVIDNRSVAPTIAHLLGENLPGADGKVLVEILE